MYCFVQKKVILFDFVLGHYSSIFKNKSIISAHAINRSQLSGERKTGNLQLCYL